jgi:transposase
LKRAEGIVEILEAFDRTGSFRAAAELAGCSHHTVARYVRLRAAGRVLTERAARDRLVDGFLAKVEEWVERSKGNVRADVVHDKLLAQGFEGSERTTRRAVAKAKRAYAAGHRRVYRPWIPEPGMWLQVDWGQGPRIGGRETLLWCAWLAWSRCRVVIPTWDRTLPTVVACLDETLRRFGGSPTYALTDNERTVTIDRIAGIGVRHPEIVAAGRHYGLQIVDPESKGGSRRRCASPRPTSSRPRRTPFRHTARSPSCARPVTPSARRSTPESTGRLGRRRPSVWRSSASGSTRSRPRPTPWPSA